MSKIRFVVTFVFFLLSRQSLGHQLNIVQTAAGALKGVELTSRQNRPYYGFLGIPYGKIPERFAVRPPTDIHTAEYNFELNDCNRWQNHRSPGAELETLKIYHLHASNTMRSYVRRMARRTVST